MRNGTTIGIVRFPGSNCEQDCFEPLRHDFPEQGYAVQARYLWHRSGSVDGVDAILIPGGFSFGDYLRSGALAQLSPVIRAIREFADQGRPVLGICNGFQILTESGLLPGALTQNRQKQFLCQTVAMRVENITTPFTQQYTQGKTIHLPIAHADGCYVADDETLDQLEANQQVVFRTLMDVNGSDNDIAGICNKAGNVLGMMPHPERALTPSALTSAHGRTLFESLLTWLATNNNAPLPTLAC